MVSTMIQTNKIIELSECNLETKTLLTGTLLKWMDIIACLAAERHANAPCVTASVDDLQLQKSIRLGQVLVLKSWINRAWNTSMEVEVLVQTEDISTLEQSKICEAFFTFVTQRDKDGNKNCVEPIIPETEQEKTQFRLANERKIMRLDYRSSLSKMKEENTSGVDDVSFNDCDVENDGQIDIQSTYCECVEIVLPQHANHHETTFGGQLMAWMEAAGMISARRLCRMQPRLVAVDEVFFRAPSKVGDRIIIKSCVNNTFDKSLEVGVRTEAYAVGGPIRHIQSAYFTLVAPDENGNPIQLPKVFSKSKERYQRMIRAEARVRLRQERRSILCSNGTTISVALTRYNQRILSYKNILSLMELYGSNKFKLKIQVDTVRLYQCKINNSLCIRVEVEIDALPSHVYKLLSNHSLRKAWDMFVTEVKVVQEIRKNEDYLLHYSMHNLSPRENIKGDDFVVLASTRKDSRGMHTIAFRSVKSNHVPALAEFHRAEVKCAGFVIEPYQSSQIENGCKLTYINQLTDHIYEYVKNDLTGATDSFAKRAIALKELIRMYKSSGDNFVI